LTGYKLESWNDLFVFSTATGLDFEKHMTTTIYDNQSIYFRWAIVNYTSVDITDEFNVTFYLDGQKFKTWTAKWANGGRGIKANWYLYETYYLGRLSPGTHTILMVLDEEDKIKEKWENVGSNRNSMNFVVWPQPDPITIQANSKFRESAYKGCEQIYNLLLPNGQIDLEIAISGGEGECDMYVLEGSRKPFIGQGINGNEEKFTEKFPRGGNWTILLYGREDYRDVNFSVSTRSLSNGEILDKEFITPKVTGRIRTMAIQAEGKIIIGGNFSSVNGITRYNLARLKANGELDVLWNAGEGLSGGYHDYDAPIETLVALPDGKLLVGGTYTSMGGLERISISRLNSDGSLDESFNLEGGVLAIWPPDPEDPEDPIIGSVKAIVLQREKILIGGNFIRVGGARHYGIARLNSDGSLDPTFSAGAGTLYDNVSAIALTDGRILIGGNFDNVNGVPRNGLARLEADGALDFGFDSLVEGHCDISSIVLDNQGRIVIAGQFNSVDGVPSKNIARLKSDGSLDKSWNLIYKPIDQGGWINKVVLQGDNLIVGGFFESIGGVSKFSLARLGPNGTVDKFPNGVGCLDGYLQNGSMVWNGIGTVYDILSLPDNKVIVAGSFSSINGMKGEKLVRLYPDDQTEALKLLEPKYFEDGYFTFKVKTVVGNTYEVQLKEHLGNTEWLTVGSIIGTGNVETFGDPEVRVGTPWIMQPKHRVYRVKIKED